MNSCRVEGLFGYARSAMALRAPLTTDTQRVGFADAVEDVHSAAVLAAVQIRDYLRAFQTIEQGRAGSLVEAMVGRQTWPGQLLSDREPIALDAEISPVGALPWFTRGRVRGLGRTGPDRGGERSGDV